jgi:hypothetical protein
MKLNENELGTAELVLNDDDTTTQLTFAGKIMGVDVAIEGKGVAVSMLIAAAARCAAILEGGDPDA